MLVGEVDGYCGRESFYSYWSWSKATLDRAKQGSSAAVLQEPPAPDESKTLPPDMALHTCLGHCDLRPQQRLRSLQTAAGCLLCHTRREQRPETPV